MAFRQQHRPQSSQRPPSFHEPSAAPPDAGTASSPLRKRPLDESEEWVLFSPGAPSTTARTHTTSTERTPRTAALSRFSDFGSLNTAARSHDADDLTNYGTEEGELDSLDDGLHAFHEPSDYAGPTSRPQQSTETVLPTHDGLGTFQPHGNVQEHMWRFERQIPRRPQARRRSSVQRRLDALEEAEELNQEQDRRERIERWRLDQSRALLEEIERETRRRRRMSLVGAGRNRTDSAHQAPRATVPAPRSASDGHSEASDESTENLSLWQRLTRRVIRDLMGIDEDTLSVIFGESLPEEAMSIPAGHPPARLSIQDALESIDGEIPEDGWQHRLLERVARELGILVHQLSEHPGAFSTYRNTQDVTEYAGMSTAPSATVVPQEITPLNMATSNHSDPSSASAHFAPTFQGPAANTYSEASLWGIEEEPESVDPLDTFRGPRAAPPPVDHAEESAREQEYWERELDVKMVFNFLLKRFSSRRPSTSSVPRRDSGSTQAEKEVEDEHASARRAAIIRQHHPLVNQRRESLPSSSSQAKKRDAAVFKTYYHQPPSLRNQVLKSSSSCASLSTKKSKRSGGSARNYWDLGGSVGSGSVIAGEV